MTTLTSLSSQIDRGVKAAVAEAIEKHRKLNQSISIWRDGKIVTLAASEIPHFQTENKREDSREQILSERI
jgi:hypothetical protein